ncbi:oxidative stress-responsive serine-rich protein 1 [Xenentodon cancila]
MEAGSTDREEETLQTAFKKLRVDAESLPGCVSVSEALTARAPTRTCLDGSGAKTKLSCSKDTWHCCTRKSSRGASRNQRRRRSKSPILHPPKFTYCSAVPTSALSPPAGCLKHRHLAVPESAEPRTVVDEGTASSAFGPVQTELCPSDPPGHASPLHFGAHAGCDGRVRGVASSASLQEVSTVVTTATTSSTWEGGKPGTVRSTEEGVSEKSACDGAESGSAARWRSGTADFRALSELHSSTDGPSVPCSCNQRGTSESQEAGPLCSCTSQRWRGVEVYSFTGLRSVISECERNLPDLEDASRTVSSNAAAAPPSSPSSSSSSSSSPPLPSGSPRSCSEQARAYVDDITIEDLSGYMEFYLYIPKKMSHMAEMMYT